MDIFYFYVVRLILEKDSYNKFFFKETLNGEFMNFESNRFKSHMDAINSCNNFCTKLNNYLTSISETQHHLAWESNPNVTQKPSPYMTPKHEWLPGEIIKMYVTTNELGEQLTLDNLKAVAYASIFKEQKEKVVSN